ncbi:hypothetical protein BIV59_06350 [Bacillus sp. MUM 13]|nr:hypothetical protein BIV59_06350 [Bacillus sp. MUM 13]
MLKGIIESDETFFKESLKEEGFWTGSLRNEEEGIKREGLVILRLLLWSLRTEAGKSLLRRLELVV